MDFIDQIRAISQQITKLKDQILTEEATKSAFVMPFIQALGYNVFNPMEVCPEFSADVPGVKGEKVDYAILADGKPIILFECKQCTEGLTNPRHNSQLHRYFHVTEAKFSVLTNGILYRFYTDIEKDNVMDEKPFFEFNMLDFDDSAVEELKRFSKAGFNQDELGDVARNLLYTREIKRIMSEQLANPSPEFVKFFASQVYTGRLAASVVERFTEITKQSLKEFINDRIADRLKKASVQEIEPEPVSEQTDSSEGIEQEGITTTEEELEGFYIVKSVLRETVGASRIRYKDTKTYFGINLDGKVGKTICRLWLNSSQKYVGTFDEEGKEIRQPIKSLDEIYSLAETLKTRATDLAKNGKEVFQ
jgi:predicted type IV restriction endonuclease